MFKTNPLITHFIKTGKAQQVATIPWVSSDFAAPTASSLSTLPNGYGLGQPWYDDFGNCFVLRQTEASTAFTIGQISQMSVPGADTVAASTTTKVVNLVTGTLTAQAEVGNFVVDKQIGNGTTGTTPSDVLKLIKANTASSLTVSFADNKIGHLQNDADAYVTAPSSAVPDNLTIVRPNRVKPFDNGQLVGFPNGVAVAAIASSTAGNYGLFQTEGLAICAAKGNGTAWAVDRPVVPDDTGAGLVKGAAALAMNQVGISMQVFAAASGLAVAKLTLLGK